MCFGDHVRCKLGNVVKSIFFVLRITLAILVSSAANKTYNKKGMWKMSWQVIFNVSVATFLSDFHDWNYQEQFEGGKERRSLREQVDMAASLLPKCLAFWDLLLLAEKWGIEPLGKMELVDNGAIV